LAQLVLFLLAALLISGELAGRFQVNAWAMGGALLLLLAFPFVCAYLFRGSLYVLGWLIGLILLPFIFIGAKLGFREKSGPKQEPGKEERVDRTFADALQMVRGFEEERKKRGFKPGWLFFQCKDDDQLLEALEYLRSTGEIPKSERTKQTKSSHKEKARAEKKETKTQRFDPYEILGVTPTASPQEIKSSYRNQMKLYHPDRVAHLGDALRELANRRTQDIQRAFETIMPQS
jgi:hypothetical protein